MPTCPECFGTVIEYDAAAGNGFCVQCGTVVEENTIVSEITFGETSSGAAVANGSFVAAGATRARMSGKYAGQGMESREQVIENGRKRINEVAFAMKLSEQISQAAQRWFNLCITTNFIKGRRSQHIAATCLYVSCRMKQTSHMLIDFSDKLRINVFTLGATYTKLIRTLNIQLPLIDPAHYIGRFAAMLEFGEETHQVATDAIRLVQRYDRDWLRTGRRPSGICGACLLLAARMNNFRRSVQEIVQVVKIADTTVKKRLEEFKNTPSGNLTVQDFRSLWLEEEVDPPAFTRGKDKRLRHESGDGDGEGDEIEGDDEPNVAGIAGSTVNDAQQLDPDDAEMAAEVERHLQSGETLLSGETLVDSTPSFDTAREEGPTQEPEPPTEPTGEVPTESVTEPSMIEGFVDLDDNEINAYLCSEEEVVKKTRLWVEFNRDYLEAIAAKGLDEASGTSTTTRKKRTKPPRPRDASTAMGATAAEATKSMLKAQKSKFSKRINYEAVGALLSDNYGAGKKRKRTTTALPRASASADEKDDGDDDKSEGGLSGLSGLQTMEPDEEDLVPQRSAVEDYYFDDFEVDGYQEEV